MSAKATALVSAPQATRGFDWRRALSNRVSWLPVGASALLLILLFTGAQLRFGNFITPRVLSSLFIDNAYLIVLACGMTLVIITGGIDLSVGAVMGFSTALASVLLRDGVSAGVIIPLVVIAGASFGLLIGVLVQYFNVQPFIASLAGMFLARGLCYVLVPRNLRIEDKTVLSLQNHKFRFGSWSFTGTVIIAMVVVLISAYLLAKTRFGRTVYAIGGNEQSAKLMGLSVARTKVIVYVISGTCAGVSGLLFAAYTAAGYALHGVGTELDTIAAVVIGGTLLTGGTGYIFGSLLGVLVYGVIKQVISFEGAEQFKFRIFVGVLLLAFVVVQRAIVARTTARR
jgi:ribose/xylose/arabinose/galactoside ABC-type transport system permease subunit